MTRLVARAETWEQTYQAFQNINFAAFDYDTVKRSLLDYVKLYFPETFNDFIESSEFVAVIETFSYIAELIAYRLDVNAHENFISTAQRRDSILRLAKLVSYSASRPLPARGLVKLQSVMTSESVLDTNGIDLSNRPIRWNDISNTNWKDQFVLVMNRATEQTFGSVNPRERFQVQDTMFELYSWNLIPMTNGVFPYTAAVSGQSVPMELVPAAYEESTGIIERRPANNTNFSFLYGQDGLGDASNTTGFFCYTKQGSLQRFRNVFDGVTPNQTYDISAANVNETDIWFNQIDPTTGETIDDPASQLIRRTADDGRTGEWVQVDLAHAQNVIFNTNPKRNKYEVETRDENRARLIFGDGEFADIPAGTFDIWARTSLDQDLYVPQSAVSGTTASFTYTDTFGRPQTFTFTFSLINTLQNASAAEDIEHVRTTAPAVYYSQDRMVNGEDCNSFMLQDASILKLRAINRTFAGDSRYIPWHDPKGSYENVKIFSDDGAIYFKTRKDVFPTPAVTIDVLISTYVQPLLSTPELYMNIIGAGVPLVSYRRTFSAEEKQAITALFVDENMDSSVVLLYYNIVTYGWVPVKVSTTNTNPVPPSPAANYIAQPLIMIAQNSADGPTYNVTRATQQMIAYSPTTSFWNTNDGQSVVDYNTLNSQLDRIVIVQANTNYNRNAILKANVNFDVINQETVDSGVDIGLPDTSRISIIPTDTNGDGVPDNVSIEPYINPQGIADLIMPKVTYNVSGVTLDPSMPNNTGFACITPVYFVIDPYQQPGESVMMTPDIRVYGGSTPTTTNTLLTQGVDWVAATSSAAFETSPPAGAFVTNLVTLLANKNNTSVPGAPNVDYILIKVKEYVYFMRETKLDAWSPAETTAQTLASFVSDVNAFLVEDLSSPSGYRPLTIQEADARSNAEFEESRTWIRFEGRGGLNFAWFHFTPRYNLVDPAPTNIIDMYIIPKGFYNETRRWLEDPLQTTPVAPTPMDLRTSYGYMLNNKMISDTIILHPGKFKLLFGSKAPAPLQLTFKVVRSADRQLTDNQIKTRIVTTVRNFFNISLWEFGETFYFTELAAAIHAALPTEISSVVPVPTYSQNQFGDLFEVLAREDEIFYPDITVDNIEIVAGYTPTNLRMNG